MISLRKKRDFHKDIFCFFDFSIPRKKKRKKKKKWGLQRISVIFIDSWRFIIIFFIRCAFFFWNLGSFFGARNHGKVSRKQMCKKTLFCYFVLIRANNYTPTTNALFQLVTFLYWRHCVFFYALSVLLLYFFFAF
jgi:hypothetical protein